MRADRVLRMALALVVSLGLCACGATSRPGRKAAPVEPKSSGQPYDFRSEGRIPPPSPAESREEPDVEEIPVADESLDVSEAEAPVDTTPPPVAPADSLADGFRIQVFATQDRDVAENARAAAAERLGLPAYLELEGGMYKIRVGDYAVRSEADGALASVRRQYYPDAWVVPARVKVPRRP
jgi:cell division septation protein DedD